MEPSKKKAQNDASARAKPEADAALLERVKALEEQVAKLTDIAGRAQADLQNAKARMSRDQEEFRKFASEMVLRKLLPVVDHLQRAFQHLPEDLQGHEWVKGIVAIEQDLLKHFSELGLSRMQSLGQTIDPSRHEVLMTAPGREGTVIEVIEEGYELHEKVLRPAKVKAGVAELEDPKDPEDSPSFAKASEGVEDSEDSAETTKRV